MNDLRDEFERIHARLKEDARKATADGSYARAMLQVMPHVIRHFELSKKADVPPSHVFDGMTNMLANVVLHMLTATIEQDNRRVALDVMLRHIRTSVRPKLTRTAAGIIIPSGAPIQ